VVRCGCTLVGRPRAAMGAGDLASKPPPSTPVVRRTTRRHPVLDPSAALHRHDLQGDEPPSYRLRPLRYVYGRRGGVRRSSLVAAVLCAAAVAVSLVPVVRAWQEASAEGVSLSLPGYFAGPVVASSIVAERNLPRLRAGPRRERHAPHQTLRKTIPKRMRWPASRCRVRRSLQRSEALIRPGERARHLARASPPQATSRCLLNGSARCGNTRSPAECHQSTSE
jgi:hypothetical protein